MKKARTFVIGMISILFLSACIPPAPTPSPTPSSTSTPKPTSTPTATLTPSFTATPPASAAHPCIGASAPSQWRHIVVLMFENKTYNRAIGPAPYITNLANQCATAPQWYDADTRVDGSPDGTYVSKPSYATLTNGLSPS